MGMYKQRALELFDILDRDRDGRISPEDPANRGADRTEAQQQMDAAVVGFVRALVLEADPNKDGTVTREEMLLHVEKTMIGKTPATMPTYVRDITAVIFGRMDAGKSGKVDKAAFEQYLKDQNVTNPYASDEFARLDTDSDGFLSADDLRNAAFAFFTDPNPGCPEQWLYATFSG